MSKLSKEQVIKLAALCRLQLTEEEIVRYQTELSNILNYVELLDGIDTSGLKPTYQVSGLRTITRADEVQNYQAEPDKMLQGVPKRDGRYIRVGRMI